MDKLKHTLSKQGFDVDKLDGLETAMTLGKVRDIVLYLLKNIPPKEQIKVFLKNPSLLRDYPRDTVDTIVIATLIETNPLFIDDFEPFLLAKTLKQFQLTIQDPILIREILKSDPTVLTFVPWAKYIDKQLLLELGFHTEFTIHEMVADLDETTEVYAICHGKGIEMGVAPFPITRYMSGPWTTCSVNDYQFTIPLFHQIVSRTQTEMYPPSLSRSEIEKRLPTYKPENREKVLHRLKMTEGMDAWIKTFDVGDPILLKRFSDDSSLTYDGFKFLLIKGKTKTFNLFSLKHKWTMQEIMDIVKRPMVLLDYSCNGILPHLPTDNLDKVGGKRTRKLSRSSRKSRTFSA